MFSEDYVLRQISLAMAVITKVLGLIKAGKHQEAAALIDREIEELIGLDANIAKALDGAAIVSLLSSGQGLDCAKLVVLADLFALEGDLLREQEHEDASQNSYKLALALYYDFSLQCPESPESRVADRIDKLREKIIEE